jgi:hypothetical protein
MNEQEIVLTDVPLVRTALTAHGDKANVVEAALWNLAVHADNKKKKKGDCIAVQPLDHRTTQHKIPIEDSTDVGGAVGSCGIDMGIDSSRKRGPRCKKGSRLSPELCNARR